MHVCDIIITDIDECTLKIHDCMDFFCYNTEGGYQCSDCPTRYGDAIDFGDFDTFCNGMEFSKIHCLTLICVI